MKTTTQKTTAKNAVVTATPAAPKALTAKQLKAQEAKSKAFFAEQEAAKQAAPHLQVPPAAKINHSAFEHFVAQADKAVVEVVNEHVETSFEAELKALQEKHGVTNLVKYSKPKTPKAEKVSRIVQNEITRPAPETLCGLIWSVADNHTTATSPAQIAQVRSAPGLKDVNDHTIKTQYARWRQFNGITGRLQIVSKPVVQGEDAGLVPLTK